MFQNLFNNKVRELKKEFKEEQKVNEKLIEYVLTKFRQGKIKLLKLDDNEIIFVKNERKENQ